MNKIKRGDLVTPQFHALSEFATPDLDNTARQQFYFALHEEFVGIIVRSDDDHIWIRWAGPKANSAAQRYYNNTAFFKILNTKDDL